MDFIATEILDVEIIRSKKFGDHRGFFRRLSRMMS